MFRWFRPDAAPIANDTTAAEPAGPESADGVPDDLPAIDTGTTSRGEPSLAALPIAGITRRRMAAGVSVVLACWIVIVFARQVGTASAATTRAEDLAATNEARRGEIALREREFDLIGRQRYVEQQARGYGLGTPREIAFTLAPDAPALSADAPGSAAVRLGAVDDSVSPLERWLTVLFGPSD
jgi:hypothetical protein